MHSKETINKTKRQPTEWEKIFANEAIDKKLIYKIHEQYIQLNIKKNQNMDVRSRHFYKEDIQMSNKHMKRYSTPLIIR